jgi:curved DNA-binding protein CbpA
MNKKIIIASIVRSLKKLDQQGHYKIADKIFNNLRTAQEVTPKTYADLMEEMRGYAVSPDALKAGYKSLALKYHPDQNNNDPIATENFKLLQQVYGRLRVEVNRSENSNNFFNSDPISNLSAYVTIEDYSSGFGWNEHLKLNEDEIIAAYTEYLKYSKYYSTSDKSDVEQPPVRVSFTENDTDDIMEALIQFGSAQPGVITEVDVQFNYTDKDGKQQGWNSSESFRAGLIEGDEEMRRLLGGDDDDYDDDDDDIRRLN